MPIPGPQPWPTNETVRARFILCATARAATEDDASGADVSPARASAAMTPMITANRGLDRLMLLWLVVMMWQMILIAALSHPALWEWPSPARSRRGTPG